MMRNIIPYLTIAKITKKSHKSHKADKYAKTKKKKLFLLCVKQKKHTKGRPVCKPKYKKQKAHTTQSNIKK